MKLTKNKLKKIIAEELQNILTENWQTGNPYTSAQSYIRRQRPRGLRYSDTAEIRDQLPLLSQIKDMDLSDHSRFFDYTPEEVDNQLNRMVNNLANTEYALQHMADTGELPGAPGQKVSPDLFDRYFKLADIQRAGVDNLARKFDEKPIEEDITKNKLKKIIEEELETMLNEQPASKAQLGLGKAGGAPQSSGFRGSRVDKALDVEDKKLASLEKFVDTEFVDQSRKAHERETGEQYPLKEEDIFISENDEAEKAEKLAKTTKEKTRAAANKRLSKAPVKKVKTIKTKRIYKKGAKPQERTTPAPGSAPVKVVKKCPPDQENCPPPAKD